MATSCAAYMSRPYSMQISCLRAIAAYFPHASVSRTAASASLPAFLSPSAEQQQKEQREDWTLPQPPSPPASLLPRRTQLDVDAAAPVMSGNMGPRVPLAFLAAHPAARIAAEQCHDGCYVGKLHMRLCYVDDASGSVDNSSNSSDSGDSGSGSGSGSGSSGSGAPSRSRGQQRGHATRLRRGMVCREASDMWCPCGNCCCRYCKSGGGDDDVDCADACVSSHGDGDGDCVVGGGALRMLALRGVDYRRALPYTSWWLRRAPAPPLAVTLRGVRDVCELDCATMLPSLTRLCIHASTLMTHLRFVPPTPATLRYVHIEASQVDDVSALAACGGVRTLRLNCPYINSLDAFAQPRPPSHTQREHDEQQQQQQSQSQSQLRALNICNCTTLSRVRVLAQLPSLRSLAVAVATLDGVATVAACGAGRLHTLQLYGRGTGEVVDDWRALGALRELRTLHLDGCQLPSLAWLRTCPRVRNVVLRDCALDDRDYSPLGHLRGALRTLCLHDRDTRGSVAWLRHNTQLRLLKMHGCPHVHDLHAIGVMRYLSVLWFSSYELQDASWLSGCLCLKELRVYNCPRLLSLHALARLRRLRKLTLMNTGISDLSGLACCRALTDVDIALCPGVRDLSAMAALTRLRRLHLPNSSITTIDWIVHCRALEEVVLERCVHIRDLSPLRALPRLRVVSTLFCQPVPWTTHGEYAEDAD